MPIFKEKLRVHQPLRKEKNCLNCGTEVAGRFCGSCGQENIVTHQSFLSLTSHFISDILHFDGKFFETLKYLIIRPGRVPKYYVSGQRVRFLDPVRMYLFTSALFFLCFFSLSVINENGNDHVERAMTRSERFAYATQIARAALQAPDSGAYGKQLAWVLDTSLRLTLSADMSDRRADSSFTIRYKGKPYVMNVYAKDSNDNAKDNKGWLNRILKVRYETSKAKYGDDNRAMNRDLINTFLHKLPYALFVSLPLFALFLKLLYTRRKTFVYSDHAVFTLYHYIFSFILLLVVFLLSKLNERAGLLALDIIQSVLFFYGGIYLLLSMKTFYMQGWGRTILKFIGLNILGMLMLFALMILFILFSLTQL